VFAPGEIFVFILLLAAKPVGAEAPGPEKNNEGVGMSATQAA